MIITPKQQENTIQLDNKLLDGEVDMMALHCTHQHGRVRPKQGESTGFPGVLAWKCQNSSGY